MKIPLFSKLTAKSRGRKVVRASARAMRGGEEDYYEAEPNRKLSHAFMVVLILHVVAVGGIYAFNHIKVNKKSDLLANISSRITQATGTAPVVAEPVAPVVQRQPGDADDPLPAVASVPVAPAAAAPVAAAPKVASAPPAPAPKVETTAAPPSAPAAAPSAKPVAVPDTYKVEKGDNPYNIAKKFGVSYQELLTLNAIEDPTKLQIGQELKVPRQSN
jgi:LysM repeat protein